MTCAWKELLDIIPYRLAQDVDRLGRDRLTELRLRRGLPAEMNVGTAILRVGSCVTQEELEQCINLASRYSPWAASTSARGYLTARGGHRIGMCGETVYKDRSICAIKEIRSLCIRVARDFPGIGDKIGSVTGSMLIIGPPGSGKTTLLRDIVRRISQDAAVGVVDERGELFPEGIPRGLRTDVLTGSSKRDGIELLIRCMCPEYIAVDEITDDEDSRAIAAAHGCGVRLLATAHAGSAEEFTKRITYRQLIELGIFDTLVILDRDKQYTTERIKQ